MRKFSVVFLFIFTVLMVSAAFFPTNVQAAPENSQSCWGQATKVFAQMGVMGEHASQQPNPRVGLRNLARYLADEGIIPDDSMQALGVFVVNELGLSIGACE